MTSHGNWARVFVNGPEITTAAKQQTHTHAYQANKVMAQNVGIDQYAPGIYQPKMTQNGYIQIGQGLKTAHNLYSPVGAGNDIEYLMTVLLGDNAPPAIGDTAMLMSGTLMNFSEPQDVMQQREYTSSFSGRGKRMPFAGTYIFDTLGAKGSQTSAVWDDGAESVGTQLGAVSMLQCWLPTGVAATGSITVASNPVNGDTIVINGVTYTAKTAIAAANDILVGATAVATMQNLFMGLVGDPVNVGISYFAGTTPLPSTIVASVPNVTTGTITLTAAATGTAGNAYTLVKTGTAFGVSGATFTGGAAGDTITSLIVASATSSGGSYTTLCTHTLTGAAYGAESIEIPLATTINRFLKVTLTMSGSASAIGLNLVFGRFYQL